MSNNQQSLNRDNSEFWTELCGTGLATSIGITDHSRESLDKFDQAYLDIYPYLLQYVPDKILAEKRVLEIGLGYGTLSQKLMEADADYHGLDIAPGPIEMVRSRMSIIETGAPEQVNVGSALEIPYEDGYFDTVVSIGCLHHTGDLQKSMDEVYRVLAPGGTAVIMIYNASSFRQFLFRIRNPSIWFQSDEAIRKLHANYDANAAGEAAPHIDYTNPKGLKTLFGKFSHYSYEKENADPIQYWKGRYFAREQLLSNVGKIAGLDLYVTAVK